MIFKITDQIIEYPGYIIDIQCVHLIFTSKGALIWEKNMKKLSYKKLHLKKSQIEIHFLLVRFPLFFR